ncbi:hypothetical protein D3C85_1671490 [compost metagenome]
MAFLLVVVPAEVEVEQYQSGCQGKPLHGVTQVFFRAHGNDRPVQAIGRRAGFQAQLMGEAFAIELLP